MFDSQQDYYEEIVRKITARNILYAAELELTYKCNLRCAHCYIVPGSTRRELTLEEWKLILDQLVAEGCLLLLFTGGEILTRSDFFDIAVYARKKGFGLVLFTNGTLITPDIADRIRDLYPRAVGISIYGATATTHEAITQIPGSFEESITALKLLRKGGIRTQFKSPLMRRTVGEYDQMRVLAEDLGAEFRYDTIILPKRDGSMSSLGYQLTDDEVRHILRKHVSEVSEEIQRADAPLCGAGVASASINPYGEVSACIRFNNFGVKAGNLMRESLSHIWKNSELFSMLRSATFSGLHECADCDLVPYCAYCPALALMDGGDFPGPSKVLCRLARIRKEVVVKERVVGDQRVMTPNCKETW